ncbi:MAG: sugar transferase [Ilumatobacteraceae bacterium]
MTDRARFLNVLVVAALPLIARGVHQRYRAPVGTTESVLPYLLFAALCVLMTAMFEAPLRTASMSRMFVNASATATSVLGAAATSQVFFPATLPRFVLLFTSTLVLGWLVLLGSISSARLRLSGGADRVIALVNDRDATQLHRDVASGPFERLFVLVDVVSTEERFGELTERCEAGEANTIVLGPRASVHPDVLPQAEALHRSGVRVRSLDDFYDESLGKLPLSSLDRFSMMGDVESIHGAYAPLKRFIDIVLALAGAVLLAVLLPMVLIGNLVGNRGPLFFRQERVGLRGDPFSIWKFRTMTPGAIDISGWTSNDDARITPFGRVLRRTHVDELPQVMNIFVGDLAVVGPRPEQVTHARLLEERLPFYALRHLVRPGLTGWAQVRYRYAASEEDAFIKLQYDLYYVRHESLATDLRIIWLTVRHLVIDGGR